MPSTRSRNKFCLSLDNSSTNTFSTTTHLNRWSEVVPPKTALTFAALWDPQDGMVTFSGAALLETEGSPETLPHPDVFDDDDLSQFISVDRDTGGGIMMNENTATLATFQDAFKALLHCTPLDSREHLHTKSGQVTPCCLQSRASSTFDGLDVYSHEVQFKPKGSLQLSWSDLLDIESSFRAPSAFGRLRLRSDLMLDTYHSEPESDTTSGSRPSYLKSRFSTTTASTSNYVDVASGVLQTMCIPETPHIPEWTPPNECASPAGSWPLLPRRRRLLRKRRPLDSDATVATSSLPSTLRKVAPRPSVSSSPSPLSPSTTVFSSGATLALGEERRGRFPRLIGGPMTPTSPATPSKSPRPKLRLTFLPRRKPRQPSSDSDGWVCIDVTPTIRQRYIANLDDD